MSDWLHNLPIFWMAVVIFGVTYLVAVAIYAVVRVVAKGERARSFKVVSPSVFPPLGTLFALFVVFSAVQVWNDNDRATEAVDREASALRAAVILANAFPGEPQARLHALIRSHIEEAATKEWPMMSRQTATLSIIPRHLAAALQLVLQLKPGNPGQETAQREMATAFESALDARRQRILISRAQVHLVKWACLFIQAACVLFAVALVHSDNRLAAIITMGVFSTGMAACVLLIAAYDRPFAGRLAVGPGPLLQVMPEARVADKCGAELWRSEWNTAKQLPQNGYWKSCEAFNDEVAHRTCAGCGTMTAAIDLSGFRWRDIAAELSSAKKS